MCSIWKNFKFAPIYSSLDGSTRSQRLDTWTFSRRTAAPRSAGRKSHRGSNESPYTLVALMIIALVVLETMVTGVFEYAAGSSEMDYYSEQPHGGLSRHCWGSKSTSFYVAYRMHYSGAPWPWSDGSCSYDQHPRRGDEAIDGQSGWTANRRINFLHIHSYVLHSSDYKLCISLYFLMYCSFLLFICIYIYIFSFSIYLYSFRLWA